MRWMVAIALLTGCSKEPKPNKAAPQEEAPAKVEVVTKPEPSVDQPPEAKAEPRPKIAGEDECREKPEACVRKAVALTRTDLAQAAGMFEVTCEEGLPSGCGNLAVMLRDGRGIAADPPRAKELMRQACKDGHEPSCENARAF